MRFRSKLRLLNQAWNPWMLRSVRDAQRARIETLDEAAHKLYIDLTRAQVQIRTSTQAQMDAGVETMKAGYANDMQLAWNKFVKALADYDRVLSVDERNALYSNPQVLHGLRTVADTVTRFAQWQAANYFERYRDRFG